MNVIIVAHTTIKSKSGISLLIGFLNRFKYKEIGIFLLYALMTGNNGGLTTTVGKHVSLSLSLHFYLIFFDYFTNR